MAFRCMMLRVRVLSVGQLVDRAAEAYVGRSLGGFDIMMNNCISGM